MEKLTASNFRKFTIDAQSYIGVYRLHTKLGHGVGFSLFVHGKELVRFNLVGDAYQEYEKKSFKWLYPLGISYKEKVNLALSNLLLHHPQMLRDNGIVHSINPYSIRALIPLLKDELFHIPTRVIIPIGGKQERWGRHLGMSKHEVRVQGETLIGRIVRLFKSFSITDIYTVGGENLYPDIGTVFSQSKYNPVFKDANKYLDSEHIWNNAGRTIIVFGDIYFTDSAIHTIAFNQNRDWTLFGRPTVSCIGKPYPEPFAISFFDYERSMIKNAAMRVVDLYNNKVTDGASLWHLYRSLVGLPNNLMNKRLFGEHLVDIDDLTDDFDLPEDYHRFFNAFSRKDAV